MSLTVFQSNKFKKGCTTQQLPTWKRCVCQEALWQKTQNATHPVPVTHPSQPFSGQFSTPRQLPSGKDILCFYKILSFNSEGFPSMGQDPQPPETARDLPCAGRGQRSWESSEKACHVTLGSKTEPPCFGSDLSLNCNLHFL